MLFIGTSGGSAGVNRGTKQQTLRRGSTAALLSAYHRGGDRRARTQVIEQNLPLVRSLARHFARPSEPIDDLVQVGAIGLIKAVDGFREDRGADLGAYAVPTIVGELRRHVRGRTASIDGAPVAGRPAVVSLSAEEPVDLRSETEAESEERALVRTALDALAPRERRIVALRFYRDWSQQRIADEVGLSQVQVSRLLSTSLTKMRRALGAA
jgi:RNA polymerase sigma-B factor